MNSVLQVLYGIGCTCAIIAGSALPLFTLIFGSLIDSFGSSQNGNTEKLTTAIQNLCPYFVIIGVVTGFCSLIDSLGSVMITEYTLSRVRHEYMLSLLRQDVGWHDTNRGGEATARLAEGSLAMSSGMEKLPAVGKAFGTLVGVSAS
jgi:ATP-binding cassette subfamily B (MDR/TAP) protein 1